MEEIWKPIPEWSAYEVSNLGQVKSFKKGVPYILRSTHQGGGYRYVALFENDKRRLLSIHRLVALAFLGPCPEGMEVCHNDGNPANNRLDNLRYDTHAANMKDLSIKISARNQVRLMAIDKRKPSQIALQKWELRRLREEGKL